MKRIFASILVLSLVFCCMLTGLAEEEYKFLEKYDEAGLLELKIAIDSKLANIGVFEDSVMDQGMYEVGVDIAPGKYDFVAYYVNQDSKWHPIVNILEKNDEGFNLLETMYFRENGSKHQFELNIGEFIRVENNSIWVLKSESKSWSMG